MKKRIYGIETEYGLLIKEDDFNQQQLRPLYGEVVVGRNRF